MNQIRYFLALVSTKNYTRAAQALYITQPTLSQQISAIEKELDTKLFERSRHKVELTPAGKALLPHAQAMMAEWNQAILDLTEGKKKTVFRVMALPILCICMRWRIRRSNSVFTWMALWI